MPHDRASTYPGPTAVDTSALVDTSTNASDLEDGVPWPSVTDDLFDARSQWVSPERVKKALSAMARSIRAAGKSQLPYSSHYTPVIDALGKAGIDYRPALAVLLKVEPAPVTPIDRAARKPEPPLAAKPAPLAAKPAPLAPIGKTVAAPLSDDAITHAIRMLRYTKRYEHARDLSDMSIPWMRDIARLRDAGVDVDTLSAEPVDDASEGAT